jgi:ribonuclease HII
VVQGDTLFAAIAAASILAKTYRDEFMVALHQKHPAYNWAKNKGYGTKDHQQALNKLGPTKYHRRSFRLDYTSAATEENIAELINPCNVLTS